MKLLKQSLSLAAILAVGTSSAFAAKGDTLSNADISKLQADYPELIGKQGVKVLKGLDQGNFKQLELEVRGPRGPQQFEVFVVDGVDAVFAGNAYSKKGEKFSLPVNTDLIKSGVALKIGTGPKNVYVVTDPECPYCQRLEQNLADDVYEKYTINIIPMPLSFHKKAKPMLHWVLAGKDAKEQADRLHAVMAKKDTSFESYKPTKEEIAKNEALFATAYKAAMELRATGTPSVYDDKFQKANYDFLLKK